MLTKGAGCADGCCPTAPPSPNTVAKLVTADPRVVGVGDALFKTVPGQTWRYIEVSETTTTAKEE